MVNYRVWNKHGEGGENEPEEVIQDTNVEENSGEAVLESLDEQAVPDSMRETLASDEGLDGIDQMLRDGEPECLDARNLKKLEQMRKDAKTPLYPGCHISKLEANLMLLEMKASNGLSDKGFNDLVILLEKMLPSPNELLENIY
jgi:hypothetical protein